MDLPLSAQVGVAVGLAALLTYVVTPIAIATARRFAFYDVPAGYKRHARPTPYLGGAAVMLAFALTLAVRAGHPELTLPLVAGAAVLLIVGTIDDRRPVSPQARVTTELVVGVLLSAAGLGWKLGAGAELDAVLTAIWVVIVVNAFNLFDNMDGAASTMGLVVAAGACVLSLTTGDAWVAAGSAALFGACLGFLPHNLCSPARIFLGDGGSMPLGLVIATLVAGAARSAEPSSLALLVGFLLVGVPVLDTCLVIVSRRRRGVSLLTGGSDHLTHRAHARLRKPRGVVLLLAGAQAIVVTAVIMASRTSSAALVYITLACVVCAAATIAALEDAAAAPGDQVDGSPSGRVDDGRRAPATDDRPAIRARNRAGTPVALAALVLVGLGAGISPLFSAYYDVGVWTAIGLGLVVAAAAATVARRPALARPAGFALVGVAGIGVWSLLSTSWSDAVEPATVDGNLWLAYAALLLLVVVLTPRRAHARLLLAAVGAGIAIAAGVVLVRLLGSDPGSMFVGGRLNSPLGYINGEGCVFAMGAWMTFALAERREPVAAGIGGFATVVLAGLTLLSQSRGVAIALAVALLVVLTAVPGARRRLLVLAVVGIGLAAAVPPVLRVYSRGQAPAPTPGVVHGAAVAILLAGAATGLALGVLVAAARAVERRQGSPAALLRRGATVAAVLVVAIPSAAAVLSGPTIAHRVSTQWRAFVNVSPSGGDTAGAQVRLFSGAGNRYDYWRIAWRAFLDHPVAGIGAGTYSEPYFLERRTTESIQNPHSIELQTLAELGLIGVVALGLLVAGGVLAIVAVRRAARSSASARTVMVAATGAAVVWFVQASGDWMHLLPGVTAIALLAIAALIAEAAAAARAEGRSRRPDPRARLIPITVAVFLLAVAGASLARAVITERYLDNARARLAREPAEAIDSAADALRFDPANLDAYYVQAAGLARFDRARDARATLLEAAKRDPGNFVTWTLLGDLEVRAGDLRAAKRYYSRAHALDPRDPALARLASGSGDGSAG